MQPVLQVLGGVETRLFLCKGEWCFTEQQCSVNTRSHINQTLSQDVLKEQLIHLPSATQNTLPANNPSPHHNGTFLIVTCLIMITYLPLHHTTPLRFPSATTVLAQHQAVLNGKVNFHALRRSIMPLQAIYFDYNHQSNRATASPLSPQMTFSLETGALTAICRFCVLHCFSFHHRSNCVHRSLA